MSNYYDKIEEIMQALIVRLDHMLPETDIANARELVDAGEYGVALDLLCNQLYEYDMTIDQQIFDSISHSATLMNMPAEEYDFISKQVRH